MKRIVCATAKKCCSALLPAGKHMKEMHRAARHCLDVAAHHDFGQVRSALLPSRQEHRAGKQRARLDASNPLLVDIVVVKGHLLWSTARCPILGQIRMDTIGAINR
eukprot:1159878-Pelagomonas_calceolata.AAC.12